ncbi:MAG: heat-inducible transcription repressor HrcA [Clostridia bacterium]|nr:heat-inducible transcription repressor HrcA [Clostridia bacterium]
MRKTELSERKREILRLVIDSFITTGEPVGSKAVMENMRKPCSSATIRNEMSALEGLGLLEQPHTSAGRIPTGRGYRVYVDSLMENYTLSFEETLLLNSLLSDKLRETDKILEDMTGLLAKMTGYAVVSSAREYCGTIDRFDGVYIGKRSFLLVMITSTGKAITKQLRVDFPLDPEKVRFLVEVIDDHLANKELGGITLERMIAMEEDLGEYRVIIPPLLQVIFDATSEISTPKIAVKGLSGLLSFPDFRENDTAVRILEELEDHELLRERFGKEIPSHLRVHIGREGSGLSCASLVTCPFRLKTGLEGAICIIGPKRMNYAKVVARLEYLAKEIHAVYGFKPSLPLIETKDE